MLPRFDVATLRATSQPDIDVACNVSFTTCYKNYFTCNTKKVL